MNADAQFSEFVKRQQRPVAADIALDWNKERDEWLSALQRLYDDISHYLEDYIQSGQIMLREFVIEINEENIGIYTAKRVAITIGAQEIMLTPIGTLLIGSKGRVDVEGSAGNSRLVLIDRNVVDAHSMFRIDITFPKPDDQPEPLQPEPSLQEKQIDWVWKIVSAPPAMRFIELNKDSLFAMLMEVSNG